MSCVQKYILHTCEFKTFFSLFRLLYFVLQLQNSVELIEKVMVQQQRQDYLTCTILSSLTQVTLRVHTQ